MKDEQRFNAYLILEIPEVLNSLRKRFMKFKRFQEAYI